MIDNGRRLVELSSEVHSRVQAAAMWQVLFDEGVIVSGKSFTYFLYKDYIAYLNSNCIVFFFYFIFLPLFQQYII